MRQMRRWIFGFAFGLLASGCLLPGACGQCVCSDGQPPSWAGAFQLPDREPIACVVTASRNGNVIEFDVAMDTASASSFMCTKIGGDPAALFEGGLMDCALEAHGTQLTLDPEDESFLGGFDFDFDVTCDGASVHHSHETFDTTKCEC